MQEIRKINDFYEMIEHDKVLVIFTQTGQDLPIFYFK